MNEIEKLFFVFNKFYEEKVKEEKNKKEQNKKVHMLSVESSINLYYKPKQSEDIWNKINQYITEDVDLKDIDLQMDGAHDDMNTINEERKEHSMSCSEEAKLNDKTCMMEMGQGNNNDNHNETMAQKEWVNTELNMLSTD